MEPCILEEDIKVQLEVDGVTEGCRILEEGETLDNTLHKDNIATPHAMILVAIIPTVVICHIASRTMPA